MPTDAHNKDAGNQRRRWLALATLVLLGLFAYLLCFVAPVLFDQRANAVELQGPYKVAPSADSLHALLSVVDLHADQLLWNRATQLRADRGHVDVPRLQQGNVAVQVFSAVTKSPFGQNSERNSADTDRITALVVLQRWPVRTWGSLTERALYQATKLEKAAAASNGNLSIIRTRADLEQMLAARSHGQNTVGGLLAIEGLHAMEGALSGYDRLVDAGYRMMSITHFFDTELGGSAHGVDKGGLTELGRTTIASMERDGIIVDLAHVSPASISDILDLATKPVVVSHTGVQGTCPGTRNLSDKQIDRIAVNGGVIGIGFWVTAVCGTGTDDIVRAVRYVADRVGVQHVGIGSDFDGSVTTLFDASGMALLTEELMREGFSDDEIRLIMGGNALRVFRAVLR